MVSHLFWVKDCSCLWYLEFKELLLLYNWGSLGSKMLMRSIACADFMKQFEDIPLVGFVDFCPSGNHCTFYRVHSCSHLGRMATFIQRVM